MATKRRAKRRKSGRRHRVVRGHHRRRRTKKRWIQGAIKKRRRGALHRALGVPKGEKIPLKKLRRAAKKKGVLGKRARLAMTLRRFRSKRKKVPTSPRRRHAGRLQGTWERPITHGGVDRQYKVCKCGKCGLVNRCTPTHDFYTKPGKSKGPLYCESCIRR